MTQVRLATLSSAGMKVSGANLPGHKDLYVDALIQRSLQQGRDFVEWCRTNGNATPWVTEMGVPTRQGHANDAQRWLAVLDAQVSFLDAERIPSLYWTARKDAVSSTELIQAYTASGGFPSGTLDTALLPAEVIEKHPTSGTVYKGLNFAGGHYGFTGGTASTNAAGGSNLNLGTYGTTYTYGTAGDYTYLASRGHKVVRITFRLERFFSGASAIDAAINSTEVARMTAALDAVQAAGMQAILVPQNFGLYYKDVSGTPTAQYLGSGNFTSAQFATMWGALSGAFKNHAGVLGYDLCNEPAGATSLSAWQTASQAAVTAIRATGDTKLILVEGWSFSGVADWIQTNGTSGWITDTGNNFAYNAHWYIGDVSGVYTGATTLDQYGQTADGVLTVLSSPQHGSLLPNYIESQPAHESGSTLTLTSGSLYVTCFTAGVTKTIANITMATGNSGAASGLTAAGYAVAILDSQDQPTIVAVTANDTTLFASANTAYTKALTSSYTLVKGQRYAYIALAVGTTAPKLVGAQFVNGSLGRTLSPRSAFIAATGLTGLPSVGTSYAIGGISSAPGRMYCYAS